MGFPQDHDQRMARAYLALDGLSIGDGFGERFFGHPSVVAPAIAARLVPAPPWRWTDDTVMALCVTEILHRHGRIDQDALAELFARRHGEDPRRGYGGGAHQILAELRSGGDWRAVSSAVFGGEGSMGNGAAMRAAPIGGYFSDDLDAVTENARASAQPTHMHPDGQAGGIAVAIAAAVVCNAAANSARVSGEELFATVIRHTPDGPTRDGLRTAERLGLDVDVIVAAGLLGNGRSVIASDTVPFCIWSVARNLSHFERAMWETVSALGDRDTTCAIVGRILALHVGTERLPSGWLERREPLPSPISAPLPRPSARHG
jgi:ADP-ribosylglycohydrolase